MSANWKTFTEDELRAIRANPYVKSATEKMIRFTVAFKEEFWRRYNEDCQSPRRIIEELGLDPEVLGQKRISGILMHLREQVKKGEAFSDERKRPERKENNADCDMPPPEEILRMRHRMAYMEQELEFIKKTILADNAARWTK